MFPKIVQAYAEQGYHLNLGNPSLLCSTLIESSTGRQLWTGGGFSVSDAMLFTALSRLFSPAAVFVIGNAFGHSTFVLADLFPKALIDVTDAETEGAGNTRGSEVTRKIAAAHYPNVQLTRGFSPQDIPKATRSAKYQLAFVDGLHTDEQMVADFNGIRPIMDSSSVVVFHDVALCKMFKAWDEVEALAAPEGYKGYKMGFTQFGVCVLARGLPDVERYLSSIASEFGGNRYHLGIPPGMESRWRFWTASPYEWELLLRRKLTAVFRRH